MENEQAKIVYNYTNTLYLDGMSKNKKDKRRDDFQQKEEDRRIIRSKSNRPKSRRKRSKVKDLLKRGKFEELYEEF